MLGLLHALEMRRGYCISANFIESQAQFTLYFGKENHLSVLMMLGEYDLA
jgi:hypothetical protein